MFNPLLTHLQVGRTLLLRWVQPTKLTRVRPRFVMSCEHVNSGSTRVRPALLGACENGITLSLTYYMHISLSYIYNMFVIQSPPLPPPPPPYTQRPLYNSVFVAKCSICVISFHTYIGHKISVCIGAYVHAVLSLSTVSIMQSCALSSLEFPTERALVCHRRTTCRWNSSYHL